MDLKQKIFDNTDGGRKIFEKLYPESRDIFAKNGKGMFRIRDEKTASAGFKFVEKGKYWILHDFGSDVSLNAIDAYMQERMINHFNEALYRIAEEFGISYGLDAKVNKARISSRPATEEDEEGQVKWEEKELSDAELAVMGATVTKEAMAKYKYKALAWYSICKNGKVTTFKSSDDYPIFLHNCGSFQKIYKPLEIEKAYRFFYVGKKPMNYINGLEEAQREHSQLMKTINNELEHNGGKAEDLYKTYGLVNGKLPEIIICSGERDAMCLAGMGYYPVWFNSETAKKTNDDIDKLFAIADKVYNVPDKDDTGIAQGKSLALQYISIYTIILPEWLAQFKDARMRPCKDLRDYIELRPSKAEFVKMLNSAKRAKFWTKIEGKKQSKVNIQTLNLLYFLRLNGFYKYKDPISTEIKLIRIKGYTVTEYQPVQIRDFVRESLETMQAGNDVLETFINSKKTAKQMYDDLDTIDIDFESSTKDSRTLFFQNVCCTVSNNYDNTKTEDGKDKDPKDVGIEITTKPNSGKYIWDTKIIPHRFTRLAPSFTYNWEDNTLHINLDNNPSLFFRFLINASRLYWREETEFWKDDKLSDQENNKANLAYAQANRFNLYGPRLESIPDALLNQAQCMLNKIYILGYLIHRYKVASNAKAIWAMEWKNSHEGVSNGGSGKSLMFSALEKLGLSEIVTLQGRSAKLTDNNFFLDRVSKSTDIIVIDDLKKNADFDTFYTMITGSITINPKNEKSFELKYEDAPNIVFTSNFAPPNLDSSTLRRLLFMANSDYYHTMTDETNYKETRQVSDDTDGDLWKEGYSEELYNADINFCIDCLQFYLVCKQYGVPAITPPMQSVMKRAERQGMGEAFYEWAKQYFDREGNHLDVCVIRAHAYDDYCDFVTNKKEQKTKVGWMKALRYYVKYCDDLDILNPEDHPWYRVNENGEGRISARTTYNNKSTTFEMIYIKTVNSNKLSTEIIGY